MVIPGDRVLGCVSGGRRKKDVVEVIETALSAQLDVLSIAVCNQERILTDIKIKGHSSFYVFCLRV